MCGEIEEDNRLQADLVRRFQVHAGRAPAPHAGEPGSLNAYLDGLFADLLRRCEADLRALPDAEAYQRLAMQSVVLARLAGFLAGHVALNEDPLRKLIEAAMRGYAEADMPARVHDHHHHHGHDHPHHHDHGD
jgi:hypothetical protein